MLWNYLNKEPYELTGFDIRDGQNLLDRDQILPVVTDKGAVIHAAAIPHPGKVFAPRVFFSVNVLGTANLIEACYQAEVPRFVFISSLAVFEEQPFYMTQENIRIGAPLLDTKPVDENIAPQRYSYCYSKMAAEHVLRMYTNVPLKHLGLPMEIVIVRLAPFREANPAAPIYSTEERMLEVIDEALWMNMSQQVEVLQAYNEE
jgi:nucleoside-diphosphate-sugar epimerase